jgi:hypothetical protein
MVEGSERLRDLSDYFALFAVRGTYLNAKSAKKT